MKKKTGHRSLEGVRSYKRTSNKLEALSDIHLYQKIKQAIQISDEENLTVTPKSSALSTSRNGVVSNQQLTISQDVLKHKFTFNCCSNININLNLNISSS